MPDSVSYLRTSPVLTRPHNLSSRLHHQGTLQSRTRRNFVLVDTMQQASSRGDLQGQLDIALGALLELR